MTDSSQYEEIDKKVMKKIEDIKKSLGLEND